MNKNRSENSQKHYQLKKPIKQYGLRYKNSSVQLCIYPDIKIIICHMKNYSLILDQVDMLSIEISQRYEERMLLVWHVNMNNSSVTYLEWNERFPVIAYQPKYQSMRLSVQKFQRNMRNFKNNC